MLLSVHTPLPGTLSHPLQAAVGKTFTCAHSSQQMAGRYACYGCRRARWCSSRQLLPLVLPLRCAAAAALGVPSLFPRRRWLRHWLTHCGGHTLVVTRWWSAPRRSPPPAPSCRSGCPSVRRTRRWRPLHAPAHAAGGGGGGGVTNATGVGLWGVGTLEGHTWLGVAMV